jgi:serine phosphatase RsbU (regulator of sigma subunit)
MSLLYGFIHRAARAGCAPLATVREVNSFLQTFAVRSREFDHYFSATLFFGIIDPETLAMHYVNAGHPAPLIRRGDELFSLCPTAPPVGFFDDPQISMKSFQLARMDRFLLYTDGVTDATNRKGEPFGLERLQQVLQQHCDDHLEFLERLFAAIRSFGCDDSPVDDCTAIVLDFHGF